MGHRLLLNGVSKGRWRPTRAQHLDDQPKSTAVCPLARRQDSLFLRFPAKMDPDHAILRVWQGSVFRHSRNPADQQPGRRSEGAARRLARDPLGQTQGNKRLAQKQACQHPEAETGHQLPFARRSPRTDRLLRRRAREAHLLPQAERCRHSRRHIQANCLQVRANRTHGRVSLQRAVAPYLKMLRTYLLPARLDCNYCPLATSPSIELKPKQESRPPEKSLFMPGLKFQLISVQSNKAILKNFSMTRMPTNRTGNNDWHWRES
ncbi:hypothetical protein HG536_0B06650 [Torulaspora globosa]|uniref:Uncharacterized protein n=1 Tax=Torulaspora globosa TaxID=48254 RepID=A0A7G3ZE61_9SACH|nr:uncharacterized protein HG536_0B06650 [Torulaspora globosa]QLL31797.1 hypothetical protein HG536_0B06650 [Torulaspora globosa]